MQVYLHIYIHIYDHVAHNFDIFYATVEIWFDIYPDQELRLHGRVAPGRGQGSEWGGGGGGGQRKQPYGQRPYGGGICVLWTCLVVFFQRK